MCELNYSVSVRFDPPTGKDRTAKVTVTKTREYWKKSMLSKCNDYKGMKFILSLIKND